MKGEREKPLGLDILFAEALDRFIGTDHIELIQTIEKSKEKRGPPSET